MKLGAAGCSMGRMQEAYIARGGGSDLVIDAWF